MWMGEKILQTGLLLHSVTVTFALKTAAFPRCSRATNIHFVLQGMSLRTLKNAHSLG
uniref:Uncharacterized protein n=1 Tax=Mus musculus TaxID=10090 RepID=Q3TLN6_MOUSE|nr:unnamed protein product [Mus musculus]